MSTREKAMALFALLLLAAYLEDGTAEKVVEARKEEIRYQPALSFPIVWDATVTQSGDGKPARTRYYSRKTDEQR